MSAKSLLNFRNRVSSRRLRASRRRDEAGRSRRRLLVEALEDRVLLAVYSVTNVDDSGPGSLRQAIIDANTNLGQDEIHFAIPGAGPHTISPLSNLNPITDAVIINGFTQSGAAPNSQAIGSNAVLRIELDGSQLGDSAVGFDIVGDNVQIRGLAMNGFGNGNRLTGTTINVQGSGTIIAGNHLDTNLAGSVADGSLTTLGIFGGSGHVIGGSSLADRNVISGGFSGILVLGQPTSPVSNVRISGNYVGLSAAGTVALGTGSSAIDIEGNVDQVTIGGTTVAERNVLSGTAENGISIVGIGVTNVVVIGNYIGTDATGTLDRGNAINGIGMAQTSGHRIGGFTASERNVISGNDSTGVLVGTGSTQISVVGNYIGTNAGGNARIQNRDVGVLVRGATTNNNTVGGTAIGAGNLISGNRRQGVELGTSTSFNTVAGNIIGLDASGTSELANGQDGVLLWQQAQNNTIGGTIPGARNIISGNDAAGVIFRNAGTSNNRVIGNYLGTDISGLNAVANLESGVTFQSGANNNTIGGVTPGERNVISGNMINGIRIQNGSSANTVSGNFIGTDVTGELPLGNQRDGVDIITGASGNIIGGSVPGAGNVISGSINADFGRGVSIDGIGTSLNVVRGNFIGLDATGTSAVANANSGVLVSGGATNNIVGGSNANDRNVISGNVLAGVAFEGSGTTGNLAAGNFIGTDVTGNTALPNFVGVRVTSASNTIGGNITGAGNLISGNAENGVYVSGVGGNTIQGNTIGLNATGDADLGNVGSGIMLDDTANNVIGGNNALTRNTISGNAFAGVMLGGAGAENNTVAGNLIGLGVDGQTMIGNFYGVRVENASGLNIVGGDVAEARNVISGNVVGAWVANSPGTSVSGNYIGTDVSGLLARGNTNSGVQLLGSAGTLGGPTPAHGNLITGTTGSAHVALANSGSGVVIQNNWMGTDATGSAILGPRTDSGIAFNPGAFGSVQMLDNTIAHVTNGINTREGSHVVRGNRIGTSADGSIAFPVTFGVNMLANDNFIGGTTTEHRNIIIADNTAVTVRGSDNTITGNWIGVYGDGLAVSPSIVGIQIQDGAARTLIGGFTSTPGTGAGNVIAGTTSRGILLTSSSGNDTRIRGNIIGLAADGVTDVTIGGEGIRVTGGLNAIIGGDDAADGTIDGVIQARNIISGFGAVNQAGIGFSTSGSNLGTRIQGNYIGTDITGTLARGNYVGVGVGNAPGTVIGGTTAGAGNVISGSSQQGVVIAVNGASTIQGNIIGLNAAGNSALPNSWGILTSTSGNLIGGDTPAARNVISGNTRGVEIRSVTATNNLVQGNYIGTDITGLIPVGNAQIGVHIQADATNNTIGGSTTLPGTGRGNVIAGNTDDGVRLDSDNNFVFGNLIGLGSDGSTIIPNSDGVEVRGGNANAIGGPTSDLRNVISGNQFRGITVNTDRLDNVIQGNFVGTDRSGLQGRGNGGVGVQLNSSLSTVVGGSTSTTGTGAGNVISGNVGSGIQFGGNNDNAVVQGNLIGLGVDGSTPIGNGGFAGVYIFGATGAGDIQIGGNDGLSGNVISANQVGIIVRTTSIDVNIEGNHIGTDITGTLPRGNLSVGIAVQEQSVSPVVIGGSSPQARNLVSANDIGISIQSGSTNVDVLGNYIGTTLAGTAALGNRIGVELVNGAFENVIGGSNPAHRNLISGNLGRGVVISGAGTDNNVLAGNFIGTNISGTAAIGNASIGVAIEAGASDNTVGGTTAALRNIISGNTTDGVSISGAGTTGNQVQGNYIGTNAAGDIGIGNGQIGVLVRGATTSNNIIGGTAIGAGNLISGNGRQGVELAASTSFNTVAGNIIGLDASGTSELANGEDGVLLWQQAQNNTIGGTIPGARNIISGNDAAGVIFRNLGTSNNRVIGNYLGTDISGLNAVANFEAGVTFTTDANNNTIGGVTPGERNVISGNRANGIRIENGSSANTVSGNFIGTDVTGDLPLGNQRDGVYIAGGASGNTIGGTVAGARNLISGNALSGIIITGAGSNDNIVIGNYVGTDLSGATRLANVEHGVFIDSGAQYNRIGTDGDGINDPEERNVVSGNGSIFQEANINIFGVETNFNVVAGNYVGLDASGTSTLTNPGRGIRIAGGAAFNRIGTDGSNDAFNANERNVIAGHNSAGIFVAGNSNDNLIAGNWVGLNAAGNVSLGNHSDGISISGSKRTQIGTNADGVADALEANVVVGSGNLAGILIADPGAENNVVAGNLIGTNPAGTELLGTQLHGVAIGNDAHDNRIGGLTAAERNIIAGGTGNGIYVVQFGAFPTAYNTTIQGNYIGTDITGTIALGAIGAGVKLENSYGNIIGGSVAGAGNIISGNNGPGLEITGVLSTNNVIEGNFIGADATGTVTLGNSGHGIYLASGVRDVRIGTDSDGVSDAAEANVIGGNGGAGIWIGGAEEIRVSGNWIGTNSTGTLSLPNQYGIVVDSGTGNTIGGPLVSDRNIVAFNLATGLRLNGTTSNDGIYRNNLYYGNLSLAIDAGPEGATLNDPNDTDGVLNFPVLTSSNFENGNLILEGFVSADSTLQIFVSAAAENGIGQGLQLVATLTEGSPDDLDSGTGSYGPDINGITVSSGSVSANRFRFSIPVPDGVQHGTPLTLVALGSTSEFSPIFLAGEQLSLLAPEITLQPSSITLDVGERLEVIGEFYDPDSVSWTATVDYGDGSGVRPLNLNADSTFLLDYLYAEPGNYTVAVRIVDNSLVTGTATLNVTIENVAPVISFNEFTYTNVVFEGQTATLTGKFEDQGGFHAVDVDWGDGTIATIDLIPGERTFTATHVYLDDGDASGPNTPVDVFRVVVTVTDDGLASASTQLGLFLIEVVNVRPHSILASFSSTTADEGTAVTITDLTFVDPGVLDQHTVTIDWGDGTRQTLMLPVGVRSLSGAPDLTHVYANNPEVGSGPYVVTIEISDDDEPLQPAEFTQTIDVVNQPPSNLQLSLSETSITEGSSILLSGTFFDPGILDSHRVVIDWGDGSSNTLVNVAAGVQSFTGISHRYRNNPSAGSSFLIQVTVADNDSPSESFTSSIPVTVINVAPGIDTVTASTGGAILLEGESITVTGTFSDPSPVDRHIVEIDWGDGSAPTQASVNSTTRTFTATHRYLDDSQQFTVKLLDEDGASDEVTVSQTVLNVAPTAAFVPDAQNNDPDFITLHAVVTDPGVLDTFVYSWNAVPLGVSGTVAIQTLISTTVTSFTVDRSSHPNALWKVTLTVTDDDGGVGTYESVLLVGTSGDDTLIINDETFTSAGTNTITVLGLGGNDILDGSNVSDPNHSLILDGGAGVDYLFGGSGNDTYFLRGGDDNANVPVAGGPSEINYGGDDRYVLSPNSTLTVIDLEGDNILDFSLADFGDGSGITFDLSLINSTTLVLQDVAPDSDPDLHFVNVQGTFSELVGSRYGDTLTAASDSTLYGVAGNNEFFVKDSTSNVIINGGADDDLLITSGINITNLNFFGDDGLNTLHNFGSIIDLTFSGGADDDWLVNFADASIASLNFFGDDGFNRLENFGTIFDLTFTGGADDDIFFNATSSLVTNLQFNGDDGFNQLLNFGQITDLTFSGGADDDLLINQVGATIGVLNFFGDDGIDELRNFGEINTLTFFGGADDDLLVNQTGAIVHVLNFFGDDGFSQLQNAGTILDLTFIGGADDDLLVNALGGTIESLTFQGDDGFNQLDNFGTITEMTFTGGADDDLLTNFAGGSITLLNFQGDDGFNELRNFAEIGSLIFTGGADDDLLVNSLGAEIGSLNFAGDDGFNQLFNLGTIDVLTFSGGADDDLLVNQTGAIVETLNFFGDDGFNQLLNMGAITELAFTGGADDDLLVNSLGAEIESLTFMGDDGLNQLRNLGSIIDLTFTGGADDDLLVNSLGGSIGELTFSGDDGFNSLQNFGIILDLTFNGGADDDLLINGLGATISVLEFNGDDGFNVLRNAGTVNDLTFTGGADDDQLINSASAVVSSIVFFGDEGSNLLLNLSSNVTSIFFTGGADDDVLWNEGSGLIAIDFTGDDGQNLLYNTGSRISAIAFEGGADDDVLLSSGLSIGTISFFGDSGDDTLIVRGSGTGTIDSWIEFDGGAGIDAFRNDADRFHTITFHGGADDDVFVNNGTGIVDLIFNGDDGNDLFENNGNFITNLVFNGDNGQDVLVNDGMGLLSLTFNGGADDDLLINNGNAIASILFLGGADDDQLFNTGSQISSLVFFGDDGNDRLINSGALIGQLTFHGGADDDLLWNRQTGTSVDNLTFFGDSGSDLLVNEAAGITSILFYGGADDDVLRNVGANIGEIIFYGDDGQDTLFNLGAEVQQLTFYGGADDDILVQRGLNLGSLLFEGDQGADVLVNFGSVIDLTFAGGADDDILLNSGGQIGTLLFNGDDGVDILVNNGTIFDLTFSGGADDDILQNNGPVHSLVFFGDDGNDTLINNFAISGSLTFEGGADNDTLINNASSVAQMVFIGDEGNDTARINGRNIGDFTFDGGDGADTLIWNAIGTPDATVTFLGGAGSDFLAHRGKVGTMIFDGGDGDDRILILGDGDLFLSGGDGNDYFQFGPNPTGFVTIDEKYTGPSDGSSDTLDFSAFIASAIHVDLRSTSPQPIGSNLTLVLSDAMGIENLYGTQYSDVLWGNARDNLLSAAEFTDAPVGPVAGRRAETQWVLLDFDSHTSPGEHIYTASQRETIRQQVEAAYRGPDDSNPWFDLRVTYNESEIPSEYAASDHYATIYFNSTPFFGRPGGLASEIDPGNFNLGGTAQVQINGMLGGVIQATGDGYEHGNPEEDSTRRLLKGITSLAIRDDEIGALKPAATDENLVILSVKVAAHELAHLLGLRHHDAFGPIGLGIHDPPGSGAFKPAYGGPAGGFETFNHLIGSPASVGSTRFDDLKGLYFGEREAIKLAYAFSDPTQTTLTIVDQGNHTFQSAQALPLVTIEVPNTLQRGINQPKEFSVQLISVMGEIDVDSSSGRSRSDWYSFTGRSGDLINIDVFSNSIRRFGTGLDGALLADDYIDSIVRVYDSSGNLVPYYGGLAENDDLFEPTDSTLIDLILPADGVYYIEVDTFQRFGDPLGDETNPDSPLNPTNLNNILHFPADVLKRIRDSFNDTDIGRYQLIAYQFSKANANSSPDEIKGFGGVDIIIGGPGTDFTLSYDLGETVLVSEGTSFSRDIVLRDPAASDWTGSTVDYGDGGGPIPLTVTSAGEFTLQHVYANASEFTITVSIVNDIGQSGIELLQVSAVVPLSIQIDNDSVSVTEGQLAGNGGSFIGSSTTTISASVGTAILSNDGIWTWSAPAADGPWTQEVTITLIDGKFSASESFTLNVQNVLPTVSWIGATTANQGVPFAGQIVWITDPGFDDLLRGTSETFTYTVNWGDGSSIVTGPASIVSVGSIGNPTTAAISRGHTYTIPGTYTIYVTVTDDDGGLAALTQTIVVNRSNIILHPRLGGALSVSGNATVNLPGAIVVNSVASNAIALSGNAAISATSIQVVGGYLRKGNASSSPLPEIGATPIPDPFSQLVIPSQTVDRGSAKVSGSQTVTLQPGIYSEISVSGSAQVTLAPGVYVMRQKGFQVTGNGRVTGHGVTIVNAGSNYPNPGGASGQIKLTGDGLVELTPPTAGPLRGLVLMQPKENKKTIQISGNSALVSGTLYAPTAQVDLTGNAATQINFVVSSLRLTGNAASLLHSEFSDDENAIPVYANGQLFYGLQTVAVVDPSGFLTESQWARLADSIEILNSVFGVYGSTLVLAPEVDPLDADVRLIISETSPCGAAVDGVLGCAETNGTITKLVGWDWYAGEDPVGIGADQFDLRTMFTHELGHILGLHHSLDVNSVMYSVLAPGHYRHAMTENDLLLLDPNQGDHGPEALMAWFPQGSIEIGFDEQQAEDKVDDRVLGSKVLYGIPLAFDRSIFQNETVGKGILLKDERQRDLTPSRNWFLPQHHLVDSVIVKDRWLSEVTAIHASPNDSESDDRDANPFEDEAWLDSLTLSLD